MRNILKSKSSQSKYDKILILKLYLHLIFYFQAPKVAEILRFFWL